MRRGTHAQQRHLVSARSALLACGHMCGAGQLHTMHAARAYGAKPAKAAVINGGSCASRAGSERQKKTGGEAFDLYGMYAKIMKGEPLSIPEQARLERMAGGRAQAPAGAHAPASGSGVMVSSAPSCMRGRSTGL